MLALIVGAIMITAGIAKLGFVADLLSKPTQIGYMNGLALTILIGQLPKLFGFSTDANGLIDEARAFVNGLASGEAVGAGGRDRPAQPGADPGPRAVAAADPRRAGGGRRRDRRIVGVRSGRPRRLARRNASRRVSPADGARARSRIFRCWSPGRWGSRWSRSPTRSPPPRRSPLAPGRRSTATGR